MKNSLQFSSVQSLSHVRLFATPWIAAHQASLSITNSWSSSRLMSIESVMPSSHLILCHPLLLLPPIPPSIRVFSNESTLRMMWPKDWSSDVCSSDLTSAQQASLSITNCRSSLKPMSIESVMLSNHLSSVVPFSSCPQYFPASGSLPMNESALRIRWPKSWSFSFNISPFNEHSGLISFRMDWLDLLAVLGILTSPLQQHSWKASIFLLSAFL